MNAQKNRITELLGIDYPIIQGGMRWVARAELAAAVGNAGGLGFISAHTHASADALAREIDQVRALSDKPFGVNLTLLGSNAGLDYEGYVRTIVERGVPVVETAGSNPAKYIETFKANGVKVIHKCVAVRHALKAEALGADAVSIDGFECAGHPGEDDIPGLILIPAAADKLKIPLLASGGFADGRGLMAALALGADGINMGTRFMLTQESRVHPAIKQRLLEATERDTLLVGRTLGDSSRVIKNTVSVAAVALERAGGATAADLYALTGASRWMDAFANGDVEGGAFPAGMVTGLIHDLPTCAELIARILQQAAEIAARGLTFKVPAA
ncbi:NAD(P)H-dependent flavin oxidoreductase [Paraburkholderia sp. SIMBA_030]|uniref:NAD(P)H-dependent flavin oxidoreductase n=1 Tax=Paraburkholderia sp. SIMBA_030 TaxID=3085773 RepID=UPI00397AB726